MMMLNKWQFDLSGFFPKHATQLPLNETATTNIARKRTKRSNILRIGSGGKEINTFWTNCKLIILICALSMKPKGNIMKIIFKYNFLIYINKNKHYRHNICKLTDDAYYPWKWKEGTKHNTTVSNQILRKVRKRNK